MFPVVKKAALLGASVCLGMSLALAGVQDSAEQPKGAGLPALRKAKSPSTRLPPRSWKLITAFERTTGRRRSSYPKN